MPIVTLIAADSLDSGIISDACDRIAAAGCEPAELIWIEPAKAIDIGFTGDIEHVRNALTPLNATIDICVQDAKGRRKMLLVSDMDSTMITAECIDELADYAGIKPEISEITERAMQGELDFCEALTARVKLLSGLSEKTIQTCLSERVRPTPGAQALVKTMNRWGAHTILVSGGFMHFAAPVAAQIGFAEAKANVLAMKDMALTGKIEGEIVDANAKQQLLRSASRSKNIATNLIMAVGDGANDIPMIEAAIEGGGMGASYHAKQKAEAAANFSIRHNDLTALLYAQGVAKADWASAD
jgi:phosphoserine phosphatase